MNWLSTVTTAARLLVKGLGYIQDLLDMRDKWLDEAELPNDLPRVVIPTHNLPPLYQVGNSCTARVVHCYRIAETYAGRPCPELSGLYNYWGSRSLWGGTGRDGGSHVRDAIKALIKYGAPPASVWPETWLNVQARPSLKASAQAFKIRGIRGYYRIANEDVGGIRQAIANNCAVIAGWDIDADFMRSNGPIIVGKCRGPIVGGHAMILDGYRQDGTFDLQNSWQGWRGYPLGPSRALVSEEFVAAAKDIWVVRT